MTVVGLNGDESDYARVDIVESKGIRIAILNYTYGTNGINPPKDMPHAVDMLDKSKVIADLQYAEENADFTIVCPHWGTEYNLGIDASQKKWAEVFRQYGIEIELFSIISISVQEDDPSFLRLKESKDAAAQIRIIGRENYQMTRSFDVLEKAAENEGGTVGAAVGLGAGIGIGGVVGSMAAQTINTNPQMPEIIPPIPQTDY
jgi:hypothetical protein